MKNRILKWTISPYIHKNRDNYGVTYKERKKEMIEKSWIYPGFSI